MKYKVGDIFETYSTKIGIILNITKTSKELNIFAKEFFGYDSFYSYKILFIKPRSTKTFCQITEYLDNHSHILNNK